MHTPPSSSRANAARPSLPHLGDTVPTWGNAFTRRVGRLAMRVFGWRVAGRVPNLPKLVGIAAPHTCTVDVFVALATLLALGVRVRWLGKHTIFWQPLGSVLRWFGGHPVNRTAADGLVGQAIALFREQDQLYLALAPEGTRRKVDRWKTGFYHIARAAQVPILPIALDYRRRVVDIGEPLMPSGDYETDLATLRQHFTAQMARHPERY